MMWWMILQDNPSLSMLGFIVGLELFLLSLFLHRFLSAKGKEAREGWAAAIIVLTILFLTDVVPFINIIHTLSFR